MPGHKSISILRSTLGNCRHVQVFHPGGQCHSLAWARTAGLREGCNWQAGGISEERLELDLPVLAGISCPWGTEGCSIRLSVHGGFPGFPVMALPGLSLFTASPKFLRSRGPWSCTIPPAQQHSCLQPLRPRQ